MIYANDDIFNISYNENLDMLEIGKSKKQNRTKNKIYNNKKIIMLLMLFVMFCFLNCVLIYTFIDLLKNL